MFRRGARRDHLSLGTSQSSPHLTPVPFINHMPQKQKKTKVKKTKARRIASALMSGGKAAVQSALQDGFQPEQSTKKRSTAQKVGGFLGTIAKGALSRFLGAGDYTMGDFQVEKNSVLHPQHANQVPVMHSDLGIIRVQHREYITDIRTGTNVPEGLLFAINPFNSAMFPWLSNIATNFEQYRIAGMVVEYISNSGSAVSSTNAALGSISIATQYNADMPGFNSKRELLNHYYAVSAAPSQNMVHAIECKEAYDPYKLYWVRQPDQPLPGDSRIQDYGVVNIIAQGSQSTYIAGELWVTYDIYLYKPRLNTLGGTVGSGYIIDPTPPRHLHVDGPIEGIHIKENACCDDKKHDECEDDEDRKEYEKYKKFKASLKNESQGC